MLLKPAVVIFLLFLLLGCSDSSSSDGSITPTDNVFTFNQINEPVIPVSTCTRLAVAAPYSDNEKGRVYVFNGIDTDQPSSTLSAQAYPSTPQTTEKIHFGVSLSMTPDGNRILVGGLNWSWGLASGYFYHLYDETENLWQQTFIKGLGFASGEYEVGFSSALSSDGQTFWMGGKNNQLFMTVPYAYNLQMNKSSIASFYPYPSTSSANGMRPGWSYKNSYDDTYIVMSAVGPKESAQSKNKVFIYTYADILAYAKAYADYDPTIELKPTPPIPKQTIERNFSNQPQLYGASLDLSLDNQWLVVGQSYNENALPYSIYIKEGTVDIRKYDPGSQQWQSNTTFTESYWDYASSISLSPDGTWLAVGAASVSLVYLYQNMGGTWIARGTIQGNDTQPSDNFGKSLFLSMDVNTGTLLVGANQKDNGKGAVYVFTYDGSNWNQTSVIQPSTLVDNDQFGYSLTCNVDTR